MNILTVSEYDKKDNLIWINYLNRQHASGIEIKINDRVLRLEVARIIKETLTKYDCKWFLQGEQNSWMFFEVFNDEVRQDAILNIIIEIIDCYNLEFVDHITPEVYQSK
jgi:hypothetical protein